MHNILFHGSSYVTEMNKHVILSSAWMLLNEILGHAYSCPMLLSKQKCTGATCVGYPSLSTVFEYKMLSLSIGTGLSGFQGRKKFLRSIVALHAPLFKQFNFISRAQNLILLPRPITYYPNRCRFENLFPEKVFMNALICELLQF